MTIQRVDRATNRPTQLHQRAEQTKERLNLFTSSSFERVHSLRFADGTRVAIPGMSSQDQALAAQFFSRVAPAERDKLQQSTDALADAIREEVAENSEGISVGSFSAGLVTQLGDTAETVMLTTGADRADDAVQAVMFGAIIGLEQDLTVFAKDVEQRITLAGEVRADMTELQEELRDWPDDGSTRTFSWSEVTFDENGNPIVTTHEKELTKEEARALLGKLEEQLATLTDTNEMARFELQQMTQDYQQALNTLSALLKSQHDSLMAIIRNCKA